jgi:hypothetical protein
MGNNTLILSEGGQLSKRGPRGIVEINGNGQAGGAISRIGSGRIDVTPGSFPDPLHAETAKKENGPRLHCKIGANAACEFVTVCCKTIWKIVVRLFSDDRLTSGAAQRTWTLIFRAAMPK